MFEFGFQEEQFFSLWQQVKIERSVHYSLFTFGQSELPYYLITPPDEDHPLVEVREGEIRIARPMIITPNNAGPEFENFFNEEDDSSMIDFLMARSAQFSNLKLSNRTGKLKQESDQMEEVVAKLNAKLDNEEEDRIAILTAPRSLSGLALVKYAGEKIAESAPDNLQELRERGLLP